VVRFTQQQNSTNLHSARMTYWAAHHI